MDFGPTKIYMFFQVQQNGPLLFHIYLWLGLSISRQRLDGIYEHVQNLIHSLPGKTVIHREVRIDVSSLLCVCVFICLLITVVLWI